MPSFLSLPGLIDCHVHFREPGSPEKGDMESESRAALAGGVHTVCEMPNTIPPTVTVEAFRDKVHRAKALIANRLSLTANRSLDIRFFFGITERAHLDELRALKKEADLWPRCCGVKLYLDHSTGDQKVEGEIIDDVFQLCAELDLVLVAHCEDSEINEKAKNQKPKTKGVEQHSMMRPPESEAASIAFAIGKAKKFGTRFHVAHLSTKEGVALVRDAKKEGLPVTCEVAPHHLFLTTDDYETLGTLGKMNPPLRTHEHQEALWHGIADGVIDCIATDHAPHTLAEKQCPDPLKAPSGVPGVETMLPLLLTVAAGFWPSKKHLLPTPYSLSPADITRLCFDNPNRIFRLGKSSDDVRITIDPEVEWTIRGKDLHSKCGWTPYEGWGVRGRVMIAG